MNVTKNTTGKRRVLVIGGGAAGLMAAIRAAAAGASVTLIEKNGKLGKKLFITGKGRCNVTNAAPPDELIENTVRNPHFLYSAFYGFDADALVGFLNALGVRTKVERGGRVFPASDKASDVIRALEGELKRLNVNVLLNAEAGEILTENGAAVGVTANGGRISADAVIVATGGLAYPATGSTGDGYRFARSVGHTVSPLSPSLVSLTVNEAWVKELQGLSLRNVEITLKRGNEKAYRDFGEMLFTHRGVSGPIVLSASCFAQTGDVLSVNLKPGLTEAELDKRVLRDFEAFANKDFANSFDELLPRKLIPVFVRLSGVPPDKKTRDITREERRAVVNLLRGLTVTISGTTGFEDAVITRGGVCVDEVNPGTMESKLVSGLYFAGEVLDVDAFTGGFNLQIAFSTGYSAGEAAAAVGGE